VLLQIFTQPVSDRPTVFLEIIQRIGCMKPVAAAQKEYLPTEKTTVDPVPASEPKFSQAGGCGASTVPPPIDDDTPLCKRGSYNKRIKNLIWER